LTEQEAQPDARRILGHFVLGERFGGTGSIARRAGYTLGVELVTAYLGTHPGVTAAALVHEPAVSITASGSDNP
jgi:uncharacterized protein YjaZ